MSYAYGRRREIIEATCALRSEKVGVNPLPHIDWAAVDAAPSDPMHALIMSLKDVVKAAEAKAANGGV